jgi:pantoate--beta-alanine ligase
MLSPCRTVSELRTAVRDWRAAGDRIGFVPTMGALHEGHASLVAESRRDCRRTIVSIFVNPLQFDRASDLESYPRTLDADRALLAREGADLLFAPPASEVYPEGFCTRVEQTGLADHLCGATRPGHFAGVLTVVLKLLNMTAPDIAYFGQKDYQQVAIVRRMVRDFDLPVEIRSMPIVREADGLAMSSRNRLLTTEHRAGAGGLRRALLAFARRFAAGESDAATLGSALAADLVRIPGARLDYAEIVDPERLAPRRGAARAGDVAAVAVFFGDVRLIDNLVLGAE